MCFSSFCHSNCHILIMPPPQCDFFLLGIPRNSRKFPIMQITLDNRILSFLGTSRNSLEFSKIPNYANKLWFEKLGITGNGRLQFCEDFEFLGIPRNSQLYKLIPRNSQYFDCEGFKKRSNYKRLKTLAQ